MRRTEINSWLLVWVSLWASFFIFFFFFTLFLIKAKPKIDIWQSLHAIDKLMSHYASDIFKPSPICNWPTQ